MKPSTDREAVNLILTGLAAKGVVVDSIADDSWNPQDLVHVETVEEAVNTVMAVDEAVVYFSLPADDENGSSFVFFVLGNDPEEVACDYGVNLSKYIEPIVEPWWE